MKCDFLVLGADGMQGLIVSHYLLAKGYRVFLADQYKTKIKEIISKWRTRSTFAYIDLRDLNKTISLIKKVKPVVVVNCADMYCNLNVYRACLVCKVHVVDLGSWMELTAQQLRLDNDFKDIGKVAITGCGSVPGIGNVMLAYATANMEKVKSIDVGFSWDSNIDKFVVPFSMKSILEEFTYDPRYFKNGKWLRVKPLSVVLERNFRSIGRQKTFLVQHPELYTFHYYNKKRGIKNIRFFAGFPEHSLSRIYSLIDLGFHSDKKVKLENIRVAPFDMLLPVLKKVPVPIGYTETENLWVQVTGKSNGKKVDVLMECIVPPLPGWEEAGCNIDTGFPASMIAEMIYHKKISAPGSYAPEAIVPPALLFKELKRQKMLVYKNGKVIN